MSNSLQSLELHHTGIPCLSLSPRVCSNSCPLSWWLILCLFIIFRKECFLKLWLLVINYKFVLFEVFELNFECTISFVLGKWHAWQIKVMHMWSEIDLYSNSSLTSTTSGALKTHLIFSAVPLNQSWSGNYKCTETYYILKVITAPFFIFPVCFSVNNLCPSLCNTTGCSPPGFSVLHYLWSFFQFKSTESVMLSNHLILCIPFSFCLQSFPASQSFPIC